MSDNLGYIGKFLIILGIVISLVGIMLLIFRNSGIPFLGKLPGNMLKQKKNFTFYSLVATSIILSIILSLLFYVLGRK